ncbi:hypothetical protein CRG98_043844 [Punica granatum]|uniref:Amino acid transporter transmembrane domain-containing protein n=1 Tax=Punica granatum TaxID=22663 RepID=A0A2I0HWP3_PUNGR|nr:hypothetical protein CRG98_043844 [Punica granatum]
MKAALAIAVSITTFFYLCCGCVDGFTPCKCTGRRKLIGFVGYAAFGDDTPGNLVTGFGFHVLFWLVSFANACIVLHLVGEYQMYAQAAFATAERLFEEKFPDSMLLDKSYSFKFPLLSVLRTKLFRLFFRTIYVSLVTE